jgi:hypothetical protein
VNCEVQSRMKLIICIWFLLGISVSVAWGQRPPSHTVRATAIPSRAQPDPEITSITFLTAPNGSVVHSLGSNQGILNLGRFSYFARADLNGEEIQRQKDSIIVSTTFGLCISRSNGNRGGKAALSAFLLSLNPLRTVWVDGVQLSMTPGVIGREVSYGAITEHELKIAVPISMPAGQLLDSIGVIVTPN